MNLSILRHHGLLFSIFLATTSPLFMTPALAMDRPPEEDQEQLPSLPQSLKEEFDREQSAKKAYNSLCKSGRSSRQQGLNELYNPIIKHGVSDFSLPAAFYTKKALLEGKVTIQELAKKDKQWLGIVDNICHNFIDIKLFGNEENPMKTLEDFFEEKKQKPLILTSYKAIQKAHPHLTQKDIISQLARENPSKLGWAALAYESDAPEGLMLLCKSLRLNLQSNPGPELKEQFAYYAKLYTLKNPMIDTEDQETNEIISEGLYLRSCDINTSRQRTAALCRKAADRGHTEAQYWFGRRLLDGYGVEINEPLGIQYFKEAAEKNHDGALFSYAYARYIDKAIPEALEYFTRAAENHGHPGAYFYLGEMHFTGNGVPEDKQTAVNYFKLAADRGHREAQFRCGQIFEDRNFDDYSIEKAFYYYDLATKQGHPEAQSNCGYILFNSQRYPQALSYFKAAAKNGHKSAQFLYAEMLRKGQGIQIDRKKAFKYYKLAADRGHMMAQHMCGILLFNGDDVPRDLQQAFHYSSLAAAQGHPKAPYLCGDISVLQGDQKQAFHYYALAADQGDKRAQLICGYKLYNGTGVIEDKPRAFYYYNLAALQDDKQALYHCALMLSKGDGVERNNKQALNCLQHALTLENSPIPFSIELEIQKTYCYLLSAADEDDKMAAYEHFAKLAPHGTPCNQYIYAYLCQHGIGGLQNYDEALQYYTPLAKHGYMHAQFCCAQIFHVRKNLDQAYEYCQMAAKQDHLEALIYLPILDKERSGDLTESAEVEFFPLKETGLIEDNTSSSDEGDATEEQLIVPEKQMPLAIVNAEAQTIPEKQAPITIVNIDAQVAPENKDIEKLTLSGDLTLSAELLIHNNKNMKQNLEFRARKEAQKAEKKRRQEEAAKQTRMTLRMAKIQNPRKQEQLNIKQKRKVSYRAMQFIKAIFGQGVKINTFSNEEARKIFAELGCRIANKKGKNTTILFFKPTVISCILENGQEIEMEYQAQTTEDGEQKTLYHNPHGHGDNNLYQALLPHLKRYCTVIDITPDTIELEGG